MGKLEDSYIAFIAVEVAGLLDRTRETGDDVIWFIRTDTCYLQNPSGTAKVRPQRVIVGDIEIFDHKLEYPRVEAIELHDRVLREVHSRAGNNDLEPEAEFGIVFNIDEEFQLRLFRGRYLFKEQPREPEILYEPGEILEAIIWRP